MIFFFIIFLNVCIVGIVMDSIGPYTFKIDSIEPCKDPPERRAVPLPFHIEQYTLGGETLVRWNLTINKKEGPLQANVTLSQFKKNTYVKVYDIHASPCRNSMLRTVLQLGNITNFNVKRCVVTKGTYSMEGLNVNLLLHMIARVLQYGIYRVILITMAPAGLISCAEVIANAVPLSSQKQERNANND